MIKFQFNKALKFTFIPIILIFTSCTIENKEDSISEINTLSSNQFSQLLNFKDATSEEEFIHITKKLSIFSKGKFKLNENIKINKNRKVDKTQFGKNISYSFFIESNNLDSNHFENLIIDNRNGNSHAYIISYGLIKNELTPIKIEEIDHNINSAVLTKQTCSTFVLTVKTWCSESVHYGYNSGCNAASHGETYTMKYNVCEGGGGYYGESNLVTGPTYHNGGGTTEGGGFGSDPESVDGSDPFGGAVLPDYFVSYKPTFRFPGDSNYTYLYPKLTEYLKNKMPNIKNIPVITNAIKDITGLSISQIQNDLEWGSGPTIIVMQLDNYSSTTDANTAGLFDGKNNTDILYLDLDFVNRLENEEFYDQEFQDSYLFFMGVTVLHEYVHYGDYLNGNNYTAPFEEGELFECRVYGENVNEGTLLFRKK